MADKFICLSTGKMPEYWTIISATTVYGKF